MLRENELQKERVRHLEDRIEGLSSQEKLLKDTLLSTKAITDDLQRTAVPTAIPAEFMEPRVRRLRDYSQEQPVSDEVFAIYRDLYSYDRSELNASTDWADQSPPYWVKEKVTYDAAYGGEKIGAYLFRPKQPSPPYQAIVYFPGGGTFGGYWIRSTGWHDPCSTGPHNVSRDGENGGRRLGSSIGRKVNCRVRQGR